MTQTLPDPNLYKKSLFLPRTEFPIRARLPDAEPKWLEHWEKTNLYAQLRRQAENRKKFTLHDGPPYANGHIHAGTALNKILKDIIIRYRQMNGFNASYTPGWDCHGLPIEWQVEELFRKKGLERSSVNTAEFRNACRQHAHKWIDTQKSEFKRLGVAGHWDKPYLTMDYSAETAIVREFLRLTRSGQIRKGARPVMWSPVEQTALAEAEIEYAQRIAPAIWVRFRVAPQNHDLQTSLAVWTTTPWTIPANQAVAYNPTIRYGLYRVRAPNQHDDEYLILSDARIDALTENTGITQIRRISDVDPSKLESLDHPLADMDRNFFGHNIPLLPGKHVTDDSGTGFVHTAPAHGDDDYRLWLDHRTADSILDVIDDCGRYRDNAVPQPLAGLEIIELSGKKRGRDGPANSTVISMLKQYRNLLAVQKTTLRDAHSWRSKAPVIRRLTPQWFIPMDTPIHKNGPTLRQAALEQIASVNFTPERGRERLTSMIRERPDWLISRQRLWGTPMTLFLNRQTGQILNDPKVDERILTAIQNNGADVWFLCDPSEFLGPDHDPDLYERVTDILDVWFDSGCTHAMVLEPDGNWPADLYLEGSDQHRGWFQSSLLHSCATRAKAPYKSVLTHGFVVDATGHKMSKSKGNTVSPMQIADQRGADILRLWTASCDYTDDPAIGNEALSAATDAYRKLRNTLRYLLGALSDTTHTKTDIQNLPGLERYVLHRLAEVDHAVRKACDQHNFRRALTEIMRLAGQDLSAFYFDIRKDCLYCDPMSATRRNGYLHVLSEAFDCLSAWLAPILVFTCEEAWKNRYPDTTESVHLRQFPKLPSNWLDPELNTRFTHILKVRKVVNAALESARQNKHIGSSLEADVQIHIANPDAIEAFLCVEPADIFITSTATLICQQPTNDAFCLEDTPDTGVLVAKATGIKCARSWKYFDPDTADPEFPDITPRDALAVREWTARNG